MTERTEGKSWEQFLPTAYAWMDSLTTTQETVAVPGAFHIVAVDKGSDERIDLNAPSLPQDLKDKLLKQCAALGWQGKSNSLSLVVDDTFFLLVVASSLAVTAAQKGRQLGMDSVSFFKDLDLKHIVVCEAKGLNSLDIFEGVTSSYYQSGFFKTGNNKKVFPEKISFFGGNPSDGDLQKRRALGKAMILTRMLQDAPPNWLDSERFAEIASKHFAGTSAKCSIMGREDLKKLGMGAFVSVGQGSVRDPKLICLEIPGQDTSKTVALVGKGVTFDAGGISLKPAAGMAEMKYDMSGAASVMGAAFYMTQVKPPVNVVCAIGAVENLPSGTASRPGDIVQTYSGKTVEILNTDAEGRLVLCDVLSYVCDKFKPGLVIDIATLTGAVLHGLGHAGAAMLTGSDKTADFLTSVAKKQGEPLWRLPLWPELAKETKSEVADLKNIAKSTVLAGTIMGGLFLQEFIDEKKTQWAHLDIAGTGWGCMATGFPSNGGSAFGLRTMVGACFEFST